MLAELIYYFIRLLLLLCHFSLSLSLFLNHPLHFRYISRAFIIPYFLSQRFSNQKEEEKQQQNFSAAVYSFFDPPTTSLSFAFSFILALLSYPPFSSSFQT
ncbi:hypothetical protein VNO77_13556 [Canavalia gladiata]|uniref:Uncharacterized protein n=1 Tax=Canavalia gladiata TaxID=3824 RepID=A0AAN9LXF5_CANGL